MVVQFNHLCAAHRLDSISRFGNTKIAVLMDRCHLSGKMMKPARKEKRAPQAATKYLFDPAEFALRG